MNLKNNTLIIGASSNLAKNFIPNLKKNYQGTYFKNKIKNGIYFDITKDNIQEKVNLSKISEVIILSALTKPDYCFKNKNYSNLVNVTKTKELINQFLLKNIKIIFFSTEFIFDGLKGNYNEQSIPNPTNIYGQQKLNIENYIKNETENYCILRIGKTYTSNRKDNSLFSSLYDAIFNKNIKEINCFKDQYFSPLFVNDLSMIINRIIDREFKGILNVGGPQRKSRLECVESFLNFLNIRDIKINKIYLKDAIYLEKWPNDVSFNIDKLVNFLGNEPMTINNFFDKYYNNGNKL